MIPVSQPTLPAQSIINAQTCLQSGWIANGHFIEDFETAWARYCGRKYGVAVSNGTTALELAVRVLDLPKGGEIIIPSFTIVSCALAAIRNGLTPIFVDVDPDTWCIDVKEVEKAISPLTSAIMPVHMYGHPADMEKLLNIANKNDLKIIEDAAQAHGASCLVGHQWPKCGSFGDLSCFSFYSNKIITTGEGGMVLTDNHNYYEKLKEHRNLCFGNGANRFNHTDLGSNFRITNLQASLAIPQIDNIDDILKRKSTLRNLYCEFINDPRVKHQKIKSTVNSVYWMHGITTDKPASEVIIKMKNKGIETRPFFYGLHMQPKLQGLSNGCPMTEHLSEYGLYLPSGTDLTYDDVKFISDTLLSLD